MTLGNPASIPMNRHRWLTAALVIAVNTGCGLSAYETKMQESLIALRHKSRFDALYDETKIDEYPIHLRLPAIFKEGDWFQVGSSYRGSSSKIVTDRLYPPFLESLPGLIRTGEAYAPTEGGNSASYYLYLCVIESGEETKNALAARLHKQIKAKLPDTAEQWETVECKDQTNEDSVEWQYLRARGQQRFDEQLGHGPRFRDMPGTFDLYMHEAGGYIILLGARMPDSLEGKVFLLDLTRAAAATLKVGESEFKGEREAPPSKAADSKGK